MTSSSPAPKLPLWIFFVTDAALIAAAFFIGSSAPRPWSETTTIAVMSCVIVGAFIVFVPVISHYERKKNDMLDDRQRALESLARTLGASAEQISIATGSLNEIADLAQKNLRQAEQLPHKLQEKIAEFQAQLANANDSEKEELEKELEELRSSESERIQSVADRVAKTASEMAKLEAASSQHLAAANEAVTKLGFGTAAAIGKAQAAAEQAFVQARQDASRILAESTTQAVKAIESAKVAALSDFTSQFSASLDRLQLAGAALNGAIEKIQSAAKVAATAPAETAATALVAKPDAPAEATAVPAAGAPDTAAPAPATPTESTVAETNHSEPVLHTPKRSRKPRREEPVATPEAPPPAEPASAETATAPAPEAAVGTAPDTTPVAPGANPEAAPSPAAPEPPTAPSEPAPAAPAEPAPAEKVAAAPAEKPARKRPARKAEDDQPGLGLELDESSHQNGDNGEASGVVERVLTSDGATRLIVTAYIGIGNRLFIRGDGPGLSWDKGVPLQFISIGKWRWETMDATAPVQLKLLKNDEQECTAIGTLSVEPGHQHEVTANF